MPKSNKYSASFTAGSLLLTEIENVLEYLINGDLENRKNDIIEKNTIQINSEASRKRVISEIVKRAKNVDIVIWREFKNSTMTEKKILLFYVCTKTYKLIFDFISEQIIPKWRSRNTILSGDDIENFLQLKYDTHPEINKWSETTRKKVIQVLLLILKQAGLLVENNITPLEAGNKFWPIFVKLGDPWFLELALLNKQQRDLIYESTK